MQCVELTYVQEVNLAASKYVVLLCGLICRCWYVHCYCTGICCDVCCIGSWHHSTSWYFQLSLI